MSALRAPTVLLEMIRQSDTLLRGSILNLVVERVKQLVDVLNADVVAYAIRIAVKQAVGYFECHALRESPQSIFHLHLQSLRHPVGSCVFQKSHSKRIGMKITPQVVDED